MCLSIGNNVMPSEIEIVEIFKALADPNRLHLFELLLCSDQTNSELMDATGLRQNLLSHHLAMLHECGLIQEHQSYGGDARRHYYSINLATARQVRNWWEDHSPLDPESLPVLKHPRRVLFLCLENATRSLMAEVMARYHTSGALIPTSAGVREPAAPLPEALWQVLAEHNLPADSLVQKTYTALGDMTFDYVIVVCDIVHESLVPPTFEGATYMHWSLSDPTLEAPDDPLGQLEVARRLYDELDLRLALFVQCVAREEAASASEPPAAKG
jgi:protein-tyrosine-phosphatase/DNA-binding transcriptional ArsR family regulator